VGIAEVIKFKSRWVGADIAYGRGAFSKRTAGQNVSSQEEPEGMTEGQGNILTTGGEARNRAMGNE
jgi:hypothetical protein